MADWISRQDAINAVEFECGEWTGLAKTIVEAFEQLPSAEIVYCDECLHSDGETIDGRQFCALSGAYRRFCSDGERRTDERLNK